MERSWTARPSARAPPSGGRMRTERHGSSGNGTNYLAVSFQEIGKCPCDWRAHRAKYTFRGPCDRQSNTRDPPALARLCYLLFAQRNLHRAHPVFCRLRVPSRRAGGWRRRRGRARLRSLSARQKTSKTGSLDWELTSESPSASSDLVWVVTFWK